MSNKVKHIWSGAYARRSGGYAYADCPEYYCAVCGDVASRKAGEGPRVGGDVRRV